MVKLTTVYLAKKEIERLKKFVELAENYNPETVNQMIIKEYAYLGSMSKVVEKLNGIGITIDGRPLEQVDISNVLKDKGNDDLHKIVRSGYLYKTRPSRRESKKF